MPESLTCDLRLEQAAQQTIKEGIAACESVPEALACDLRLEQGAQQTIKDGIAHCESVRDYVSRDLLQEILDDTEEHIDFLETQLDLIGKVGEQNYLQSMMGELE